MDSEITRLKRTVLLALIWCILVSCSPSVSLTPVITNPPDPEEERTLPGQATSAVDLDALIRPSDLHYLGAFRLPDDGERPKTFAYGGNAMTYNPTGDASSPDDGYPGSLFITGHDRLAYGELPDGSQVAEVTIPVPSFSRNPTDLPSGNFLQTFQDVTKGYFKNLDEIPRIGLAYLDVPDTGPKIHICWGQHMPPESPKASHAVFDINLGKANIQGSWYVSSQLANSTNGYLFTIPFSWADQFVEGKYLATGRFRDGGWSGMGPSLFAYKSWTGIGGRFASPGTQLDHSTLLLYRSSSDTDKIEDALLDYQHPDEWEGGAWLTTDYGATAVIFAGTKGTGSKYWYGYVNPSNPEQPCVDGDMVGEFTVCRLANGSPCPENDLIECRPHNDYRGWWSSRFDAQIIFYNPDDLARVAAAQMSSWEPQPYAVMDVDEVLFLNPDSVEEDMLGTGNQRRFRVGPLAYDRDNQLLYLLEPFAEGTKPVVHAWYIDRQ